MGYELRDQAGWVPADSPAESDRMASQDKELLGELLASGVGITRASELFRVHELEALAVIRPRVPKRLPGVAWKLPSWALGFDMSEAGCCNTDFADFPGPMLRICAGAGLRPIRHRTYRPKDPSDPRRLRTVEVVVCLE